MKASEVLELMEMYGECPRCGSQKLGNGEGELIIEEKSFYRECKCGFSVKVDDPDEGVMANGW